MIALSKYYAIETDHLTSILFSRGDCVTECGSTCPQVFLESTIRLWDYGDLFWIWSKCVVVWTGNESFGRVAVMLWNYKCFECEPLEFACSLLCSVEKEP